MNTPSRPPNAVDTETLLRSLGPVVAKPEPRPETPAASPSGVAATSLAAVATPTASKPVRREVTPAGDPTSPVPAAFDRHAAREPAADREPTPADAARRAAKRVGGGAARAKMDVAINPGEGSTALYVRVPRITHVALKLLALQNQVALDGPQDLASIVRTAIDEYLDRQHAAVRAAG